MSRRRLGLDELRELVLSELERDGEWWTPSDFRKAFLADGYKLGINGWDRCALTLERLANDGEAEIKIRGARRSFRSVR